MKIAFFTDVSLPYINGVSTSLDTLSTELGKRGHEVVIFAPKPSKDKITVKTHKNVTLEYIPSIPAFIYPDSRLGTPVSPQIVRKVRRFNPDIIHIQTPYFVGAAGIFLGKLLRKPIVASFHGYFMEPEYLKTIGLGDQLNVLSGFLWKYASFICNQSDAVHTPAEFTRGDLIKKGVKRPVFVIPNIINTERIKKVSDISVTKLKKEYSLKNTVFLYVGRVSPEKNIPYLIKSFQDVRKKHDNVSLLIVGDGPDLIKMKKLKDSLSLGNDVIFTGEVGYTELLMKGYYQLASAFITPSTSELQPMTLIEAMFFSKPLIGVSERGCKEMIENVGILAKPNNSKSLSDAMLTFLSSTSLQKKLSKASKETFDKKYSQESVVKQFENLYETVKNMPVDQITI